MSQKAETRDVSRCRYIEADGSFKGIAVEFRHGVNHALDRLTVQQARLGAGCQSPGPQRFCQDKDMARMGGIISPDLIRVAEPHDRQAKLGLFIFDAVAARDCDTGFHAFIGPALENPPNDGQVKAARKTEEIQGCFGDRSHSVDVTQGIGRGDPAVIEGVVNDGRKEIHRLDDGDIIRNKVDTGIILGLITDQEAVIFFDRQAGQELGRTPGPTLPSAAGAVS